MRRCIDHLYVSQSTVSGGVMCVLSGSWFGLVWPALSSASAFVPQGNELWRPWLQLWCLIATEDKSVLANGGKDQG